MTTGEYLATGGEPAARWIRVSSDAQDEANQNAKTTGHIEAHGYREARPPYVLHDRSAFKGEQDAKLNEVLADMRSGLIKVLVVRHSDRLERRGAEYLLKFLRDVREIGGRVESVEEPMLGKLDMSGQAVTALSGVIANMSSVEKSEKVKDAFDRIDTNGAIRNRAGYGHRITGEKYSKRFELDDAEADIIRLVVSRYLSGQSLMHVCRWLTASGHRGRNGAAWTPKTLGKVLRSETLIGRYHQGDSVARVPSIITVKDHKAVLAKLDAKAYRKGVRTRADTAFLTSILHCGVCGRPMYRLTSRGNSRPAYYCRPKDGVSCKMMIDMEDADQEVIINRGSEIYVNHRTQEIVIPGHDYADDIEQIVLDIKALDPKDPDWLERVTAMKAEIARLALLDPEPPVIEIREVDTVAEANAWQRLPIAEKRQRLLDTGTKLYAVKDADGNVTIGSQPAAL